MQSGLQDMMKHTHAHILVMEKKYQKDLIDWLVSTNAPQAKRLHGGLHLHDYCDLIWPEFYITFKYVTGGNTSRDLHLKN